MYFMIPFNHWSCLLSKVDHIRCLHWLLNNKHVIQSLITIAYCKLLLYSPNQNAPMYLSQWPLVQTAHSLSWQPHDVAQASLLESQLVWIHTLWRKSIACCTCYFLLALWTVFFLFTGKPIPIWDAAHVCLDLDMLCICNESGKPLSLYTVDSRCGTCDVAFSSAQCRCFTLSV